MASTDAQKRATIKYMKEKLEKIEFRVPKGRKDKIREFATSKGMSLSAYITTLIDQDMQQNNEIPPR